MKFSGGGGGPLLVLGLLLAPLAGAQARPGAGSGVHPPQASLPIAVIPLPVSVKQGSGEFLLNAKTRIAADRGTHDVAELLGEYLRPATGYSLEIGGAAGRNTIALALDKKLKRLGPEGYRLEVKRDSIRIRAYAPAGVFYGVQTLRQLLPADVFRRSALNEMRWSVPVVEIEDTPRFSWRGEHMDVARHFMPKEFILKFLDLMALHKLNVFHWHLVDDEGWRVEIKKYPRLALVGGATDYTTFNPVQPMQQVSLPQGGYYTQDDIHEVVRYASERFITVLPEIEMPGHSSAAIAAYPELGNRIEITQGGGDASVLGARDSVLNVDDSTIHFMQDVLSEVLMLFPSKFVHVGGDEVEKRPWQANPRAQQRMHELGLKNEEELQSWFIGQMDQFLTSRGRRLVGWDEILEGGLAPGATVMSWRGIAGGIAAARAGHDVIMAPTQFTYFDYYQWPVASTEPRAISGFLPLELVYSFDPIPPDLSAESAKHVLGAQSQLWSEWIPHRQEMEYMAFPRLCALAEVVWSPQSSRNFADFANRLTSDIERLKVLDVHFRPVTPLPAPAAHWEANPAPSANAGASTPPAMPPTQAATPPAANVTPSAARTATPAPTPVTPAPAPLPPGPFTEREWDVSNSVRTPGTYVAAFIQTQGGGQLEIEWVELREDGNLVARVTHPGSTDTRYRNNDYDFLLPTVQNGSKYTIRASIRAIGVLPLQLPPSGDVYLLK
jgi:hexosaminidase